MDMFSWLPLGRFDEVDTVYPTDGDFSKGIQPLVGMLGQTFEVDKADAVRYSKNLTKPVRVQCVRLDPAMSAAIGTAVRGRPVFWSNRDTNLVTTDATTASRFAGVLLETVTAKGNITFIGVQGTVPGLFAASVTNGAPAINMHITLAISGGVAAFDVLADVTAVTTAIHNQLQNVNGKLEAVPTAATVSNIWLGGDQQNQNAGII